MSEFKWRQFEGEIILWAVRRYCRYGISYHGRCHLLHRLSGQAAYPSGSPTEHSGTKRRAEESWDRVLKATRHHADSSEDEAAETDNGPRVYGKGFKRAHQGLSAREVHRSLGVGNACDRERGDSLATLRVRRGTVCVSKRVEPIAWQGGLCCERSLHGCCESSAPPSTGLSRECLDD